MSFVLPELPYAYDALEPHIDARTMEIHHMKHHNGYVSKLNAAVAGYDLDEMSVEELLAAFYALPEEIRTAVRNQGGGHANHSLFWTVLSGGGERRPEGRLMDGIDRDLGGFDRFVKLFTCAAMGRFGSGWAWLSLDTNRTLLVESTPNQDSPILHGHTPILCIDLWEHAYYLKFQNRRADYVDAFFNVIDWKAVARHFEHALEKEPRIVSE